MSKRAKNTTEIQILMERVQYLAGKLIIANALGLPEEKAKLFRRLGYKSEKFVRDGKEKIRFIANENATLTLDNQYLKQYKKCAEALDKFYKTVDLLQSEKLKYVAELRYVEGCSWKEISKKLGESDSICYTYRRIIDQTFKEKGLDWILSYDALNI